MFQPADLDPEQSRWQNGCGDVMEWLNDGQKIQRYRIQSRLGNSWTHHRGGYERWAPGHRANGNYYFANVTKSSGAPALREFQIFHGGGDQVSRLY